MASETPPAVTGTSAEIGLESQAETSAIAHLAELLGGEQAAHLDVATTHATDVNAYDGHVALALDHDVPADLGSTLDLLTHAHDLFDVPAMHVVDAHDGVVPT